MVKINTLLTGFLSLASASAAFVKRYDNSTSSCVPTTISSTSIVSVYGPQFTGVPSNKYVVPTVVGDLVSNDAPEFTVYIPQSLYNLTGLELELTSAVGFDVSPESYTLYSGDIGDFVYPGQIYETSNTGLVFDGRTQDPLLKITIIGIPEANQPVFIADFVLTLDVISSSGLQKRDTLTFNFNDIVTSYTTFCPAGVDTPSAKTMVSLEKTVTIGATVTVINTVCEASEGVVATTLTGSENDTTFTTVVTLTQITPKSKTSSSSLSPAVATSASAPVEQTNAPQQTTVATATGEATAATYGSTSVTVPAHTGESQSAEGAVFDSTSVTIPEQTGTSSDSISVTVPVQTGDSQVYEGVAASNKATSGALFGVIGLMMFL
ncbi:hypothetical protein BOH78_2390 [Pichia kudriavzevii]|uniref:Uncharacterized protein n=1 Tax=Pichia kudriavzevii TaxID=4909 RepID=A0A1V2LMR2_PICKU|nr:hypothetical protein BOH78_2390 [Pichia kudriavzevii]